MPLSVLSIPHSNFHTLSLPRCAQWIKFCSVNRRNLLHNGQYTFISVCVWNGSHITPQKKIMLNYCFLRSDFVIMVRLNFRWLRMQHNCVKFMGTLMFPMYLQNFLSTNAMQYHKWNILIKRGKYHYMLLQFWCKLSIFYDYTTYVKMLCLNIQKSLCFILQHVSYCKRNIFGEIHFILKVIFRFIFMTWVMMQKRMYFVV